MVKPMIDPTHPLICQVLTRKPIPRRPEHLQRLLQILDAGIMDHKPLPPRG
ncbi:hypothetical protein LQF76_05045 [Gloeomargaritales cyanobacterium VI4D9]|nr:hypothetical protein LQF76_05045 [Gloeomargaritales cyanobacterium VI4D9]